MVSGKNRFDITGYITLSKPLLSLAVTFSGIAGYLLVFPSDGAAGAVFFSISLFILAGGSAALNQYQERKFDKLMSRTENRPIPAGRLSPNAALTASLFLIFTGSLLLYAIGPLPAALGLLNVVLYNFIYTPLKRISWFAIIPGGVVGSLPPAIGFFAAGATSLNAEILILCLFMFVWQMPHFWLLMIRYRKEYSKAGYVTLSDRMTDNQVRRITFAWAAVSSFLILLFAVQAEHPDLWLLILVLVVNFSFIVTFFLTLFGTEKRNSLKRSFILLNLFSAVALILMVVLSLLKR